MIVIAYDIKENNKRNKVHTLLNDFGESVQKSVFQTDADEDELTFIVNRISELINVETDKVIFYFVNKQNEKKTISLGKENESILNLDASLVL